mgnify:CR=1 FL=1
MAKRLSQEEKKEIIKYFKDGISINKLSERFNCTKLTISRNLKKILGNEKYKKISNGFTNNKNNKIEPISTNKSKEDNLLSPLAPNEFFDPSEKDNLLNNQYFQEIAPLNINLNNENQKDLSSIPLSSVIFPETVYMVVDKKIELEIKNLKDFPEWQFLPEPDLERKVIEIFVDIKNAKIACNKDQKVIKVPNTKVFKIVAPFLLARGISRMIKEDKLIAI